MTKRQNEPICDFCGRKQSETDLGVIVLGPHGEAVCEECAGKLVEYYKEIREQLGREKEKAALDAVKLTDVPKPKEIKEYLDHNRAGGCQTHSLCGGLQSLQTSFAESGG